MAESEDSMKPVAPARVLREIAKSVPDDCRENIVVIGSLAVGYHYFADKAGMIVRTKDADCLLSPRVRAIPAGVAITEKLFDAGWRQREGASWGRAGDEATPEEDLPAVRLHPPGESEWFIELLTVPASPDDQARHWIRLITRHGHFALCSFGFLSLANFEPNSTPMGLRIARPEMMALANLLEHPRIGPETMSRGFSGRPGVKRANKDLGRVLAISRLAIERHEDALLEWPQQWTEALRSRFPEDWQALAKGAPEGIDALLASEEDLEQAWFTCVNGLLASKPPKLDDFRIVGKRLMQDALRPFAAEA